MQWLVAVSVSSFATLGKYLTSLCLFLRVCIYISLLWNIFQTHTPKYREQCNGTPTISQPDLAIFSPWPNIFHRNVVLFPLTPQLLDYLETNPGYHIPLILNLFYLF